MMIVGAVSDRGIVRSENQDFMYASSDYKHPLFIVADGMGGHKSGDIASSMAVEQVLIYLDKYGKDIRSEDQLKNLIVESISHANDKIYLKSLESNDYNGMGTTFTMAYIYEGKTYIGHVGDSRAYLLRNDNLHQITQDHTLISELLRNGSISKEEALTHPQRNMITRAVGTSTRIDVDVVVQDNEEEDILLLCSDGLTNMIDEKDILRVLIGTDNIEEACNQLVLDAKANGGKDNITVIGIKFNDEVVK